MTYTNKATVNFSGGEVSPQLVARTDLPLFNKVLARMENFIAEPQGPARYRNGTRYVHHTRNNNLALFIPFQFSDIQAYLIEMTEGYFRFYKDEGLILSSNVLTITGITRANPGVLTYTGTDPVEGQEVYLTGIVGMTELNGTYAIITALDTAGNTFQLKDVFGNNINTTAYTVYSSGGTATPVYEIKVPYRLSDMIELMFAQNADLMYLDHRNYAPRKLTRTGHNAWTISRYSRTNDPFTATATITGITQANPGVVTTSGAHGLATGALVYIDSVVGMTEVNDRHFTIIATGATTYSIGVNTSGYTAYSSGGVSEIIGGAEYPGAVGFTDDGRLGHHGTRTHPESMWYSRGPSSAGAVRFDDFTTGTNPNDALFFTLAPLQGKVDSIRWVTNTDKYIAVGTFGSIRRVYGSTEQASIATDEITAKAANSDGVLIARPIVDGSTLFYIGRSGLSLETLEYDYTIDGYAPDDKNLVASHLTVGGLKQIVRQVGRPTLLWSVRNDGVMLALTFKAKENIAGWHRHTLGGDGIVEASGVMPRSNNQDQLWISVKRTINGHTVRYVEFFTDQPVFPDPVDYYTGSENRDSDLNQFLNYQSEVAKRAIHVDSSLTYDGSSYGTIAGASITMGAGANVTGTVNVTVTASTSVFTSDMVGREVWGAYDSEGVGGGRLEITGYTSGTVVRGTILSRFPALGVFAAGSWFLTATSIGGLKHLEGETVYTVTDGAVPETQVVTSGTVTIVQPASVVHIGYGYRGIMQTLPLEQGGVSGPAQSKPKIVAKAAINFVNSAGVQFGTNLYDLTQIEFRTGIDITDRPVPLFTGIDESSYEDSYEGDKTLIIIQDRPLPCMIASVDVFMATTDE